MDPVLIKQFDTTIAFPSYKTTGAAAFDLSSRLDIIIPAMTVAMVPLNVAIQLPPGFLILQSARSSLHKKGLLMANGVGIMDTDYCGNEDEYQAILYNFSKTEVLIEKGERIVQACILPLTQAVLTPTETLTNANRGGIGSTGLK